MSENSQDNACLYTAFLNTSYRKPENGLYSAGWDACYSRMLDMWNLSEKFIRTIPENLRDDFAEAVSDEYIWLHLRSAPNASFMTVYDDEITIEQLPEILKKRKEEKK